MALVIDDAQELDDASAILLDQLVERGGTFVVFTVRTGEGDASAIVGKWKDQQILRIEVGPLPERDLRTLAVGAVGGPIDGATLQAIVESSAGNVLFLRELIQGAMESGALISELGLWHLKGSLAHSPRLRDLIELRLTGLSESEREALELVALSDPVDLALLERLLPLQAVEGLERRGLLDVLSSDSGAELRLNHPLYGEVVRAHLPSIRRIRLSRSLADAAEHPGEPGELDSLDTLRVAVWRLDGGGGGRMETTQAAARTALRTENYALAVRLGSSVWEQSPSVEAALVLDQALDFLGRARETDELLGIASTMPMTDRQRTSLTVRWASALFRTLGEADRAHEVIDEAAAAVSDPVCRRELDALRGNHLLLAGEVAQAIAVDEALLLVPGDAAFAQASLDVGTGLALAGRTREAIDHTAAGLSARIDLDDEEQLSAIGVYLVAQSLAHLHAGNLQEAEGIGNAGYQVSVQKGNADGQAWFASILGSVLLAQGRPVSATNMFRETATLFGTLNHPGRRWGLGGIALAGGHLGNDTVGTAALAELDEMAPTAVRLQETGIMRGRAWTALVRGEVTAARDMLWGAVAQAERWGQYSAAAEALHDLVRIGAVAAATEGLERIVDRVDGALMDARVSFARAANLQDARLAAEATDRFEAIGALLFAAEAATLERNLASVAGLRRRASESEARADRLLEQCEGARTPGLAQRAGASRLSEREREVAALAAQDLTSREIAERLFVSVRTVDNHLQQVYMKLGVKRRSELAERLSTAGAAPESL
jgi:DNA-binding CsgD family transcriptional regulator